MTVSPVAKAAVAECLAAGGDAGHGLVGRGARAHRRDHHRDRDLVVQTLGRRAPLLRAGHRAALVLGRRDVADAAGVRPLALDHTAQPLHGLHNHIGSKTTFNAKPSIVSKRISLGSNRTLWLTLGRARREMKEAATDNIGHCAW